MTKDELLALIEKRGGFFTISFWRNNPAGTEYNFQFHAAKPKILEEYDELFNSVVPWFLPGKGDIYFFDKDCKSAHITPAEYLTDPVYRNYY